MSSLHNIIVKAGTHFLLDLTFSNFSGCILITAHNVAFQLRLMREIREAIKMDKFPEFIQKFMKSNYPKSDYPAWTIEALKAVNVELE